MMAVMDVRVKDVDVIMEKTLWRFLRIPTPVAWERFCLSLVSSL
jgi:hypothetical protein